MKKTKWHFWAGISIIFILATSYFIPLEAESGSNFVSYTKLLGILIFYNPFILAIYLLIALILIRKGLK